MAENFAVTIFCRSLADMPTQSRGHGTRRLTGAEWFEVE